MEKGKNKIDIYSDTINEDSGDVENTSNQVASTPHNNENHSSSFYSLSTIKSITVFPYKIGYTFVATGWNYFVSSYAKIIFRVHLPKVNSGDPVIVGNIEELGNWKEPKVKLKQYNKDVRNHTSYWYSDPLYIPNVRFQNTVKYKYAVCSYNNLSLEYEGSGPNDNRVLDMKRQQFDIWKNNSAYCINVINDYMFLNVIYESKNIKGMILDYESILKQHHGYTLSVTDLQFISDRVSNKSTGRLHFLCFLLGHIANNSERFELPREFQTVPLLRAFFKVRQYTFPSDSWLVVLKGVDLLIHQNIRYGIIEWLEIFTIAQNFDPQYEFIDTISFSNCENEKYIEHCFKYILKIKFDENNHVKIIKWLMSQCKNVKNFSIVWRFSNKSDKQLQQLLVDNINKILSKDDPANLYKNFIQLPDDIRDRVSDLLRKRVLDLLTKDHRAILNEPESKSIYNLLNSGHLNWTKDEYIGVFEIVSTLNNYQILGAFPSLLKNWKEMYNDVDHKITQLCIKWYKKLMDIMSTAHKKEYVSEVLENLSNICSLVNDQSTLDELKEIAFNHIKGSSETSLFSLTTKIESFGSEAVHVLAKVIEKRIDSMEFDRVKPLLNKMQVICGSNGDSLNIPNIFCEITLLYIMSRLKINSKIFSDIYLRECAEFWNVILRATGSTKMFHSQQLVQINRANILELAITIRNRTINVHHLQLLLTLDEDFLHVYLNASNFNEEVINKDILVNVRLNCQFYEQRMKKLGDFYNRFCPLQKTKDVLNYLDELSERSKNNISLDESLSEAHWNFHKGIISIAESTNKFNKSQTFYNVFEKCLNEVSDGEEKISVEFIAQKLMKVVLEEYAARCKQYENWESLKCSVEIPFWSDVSNFDDEIKLMESYVDIRQSIPFMVTIYHLSRNKLWKQRTGNLSKIAEIFKVKEN